jgi:hypothetical protein
MARCQAKRICKTGRDCMRKRIFDGRARIDLNQVVHIYSKVSAAQLVAAVIDKLTLTNGGATRSANLGVSGSNPFGRAST